MAEKDFLTFVTIFIAVAAVAVTAKTEIEAPLGKFELYTGIKNDNVTKLMAFMKFEGDIIKKVRAAHKLTMEIIGGDPKYIVVIQGIEGGDIRYEFENSKPFHDSQIDGRASSYTVNIHGRVAVVRQKYEGEEFTAEHFAFFYPWGCELTMTATSLDGKRFHMSRIIMKRIP